MAYSSSITVTRDFEMQLLLGNRDKVHMLHLTDADLDLIRNNAEARLNLVNRGGRVRVTHARALNAEDFKRVIDLCKSIQNSRA